MMYFPPCRANKRVACVGTGHCPEFQDSCTAMT